MTKLISLTAACLFLAAPAFAQQGTGTNGPTTNETSNQGTGVPPSPNKPVGPAGPGTNGPGTNETGTKGTGVAKSKKHKKAGPNGPNGAPTTDPSI